MTQPPRPRPAPIPNIMEPSPPAPCTGAGRQPLTQHLSRVIAVRTGRPLADAAAIPGPPAG
jgi:hypothetical protein